ncbi:MAG TPA: histidine phosphatase family protein [Clostridiaceae bacterium]|jgi:broad specificity phosphatase PhoE|nr:histidine phosphatase family protein [Clostridiaceae bacterium]
MRLFMIRHGETQWNKWHKLQGQVNIPLNETGETEARKLAEILQNKKFDAIYSSPLNRCRETAKIVFGHDADIILEPLIMEMAFGIYEGFAYEDTDIDESHDLYNYFYDLGNYVPPKGGESVRQVAYRAKTFLDKMLIQHENETVIAFSHGALIYNTISVVRNLILTRRDLIKSIKNCSVTVFNNNSGQLSIEQEAIDVIGGETLIL